MGIIATRLVPHKGIEPLHMLAALQKLDSLHTPLQGMRAGFYVRVNPNRNESGVNQSA